MPDWEERISSTSHPALRLEHEVRYRAAASIVAASDVWCDLGCGSGLAAAAGIGSFGGHLVLVDKDGGALQEAVHRIESTETTSLIADLSVPADLGAIRETVQPAANGCITCFEVLEHLRHFGPLVEFLLEASESLGFTVILSVPNDAHFSNENPYHQGVWGESAFAELRSLLPTTHIVAHQLALGGSWIAREPGQLTLTAQAEPAVVPTHLIAAFGTRSGDLGSPAQVSVADLASHRQWERQREADLAYFKALSGH